MILYLIFIASLLAIIVMIGIRIRQLRLGRTYTFNSENLHFPDVNFAALKNTVLFYSKYLGHRFVLILLRLWIKGTYFLKRKARVLEPKIRTLLTPKRRRHLPARESAVSHFLHNISEYKKRIQRAHAYMKRQEEAKEKETGTL
ncbi:MAG: hypothetical protein MUD00_02875 [Candidatus Pacebacteria bacterium]|jgi:hypothetical protein|nr:hypothetical protein [Candidatus Paceibacterota bacterium]